MSANRIEFGDCRDTMRRWAKNGVRTQTCVTSPPYFGLRDYGHAGQIGMEETPEKYIAAMIEVFRCVRDVLADDGTLWLNIGDSYATNGGSHGGRDDNQQGVGAKRTHANGGGDQQPRRAPIGLKHKDLVGIPWMLAFALRADGWYLRQDIIWHKPNPMPESVRDRCTKAHEYIFLLSKSERYFFDSEAMREEAVKGAAGSSFNTGKTAEHQLGRSSDAKRMDDGKRNRRSVWTVATRPYKGAHFATFPTKLIEPCILAGSRHGDVVLDPFMGSGTTAQVAVQHGRHYLGCELNPAYADLQRKRIDGTQMNLMSERLEVQS
jgi:DNA modification methylase